MAWMDYKKAYDMLPHSWIIESLQMARVAKNVEGLLRGSMSDWKTVLTAGDETLGEVEIRRGIFQGDSLSPLLFVVAMIPLTLLIRREKLGYSFGNDGKKISHLLFMDDLKLFGQNESEIERLVEVVWKFSTDIRMVMGLDKCAVLVVKGGKRERHEGFNLPGGSKIQDVDEEGYKYLGVLEADKILVREMKESVKGEYLRRVRLLAGSKLKAGNLVKGLNAWAVSVVRYTAGILDFNKSELKALDVKTRKILTRNGMLHRQSSVDRLYMKRCVGGRGLISVMDCVRSEEASLRDYVLGSDEWMLAAAAESLGFHPDESKNEYVRRRENERVAKLMGGERGKYFEKIKKGGGTERSWNWLRNGYLDKRLEGYLCAAQERVLQTDSFKKSVLRHPGEAKCRRCGGKGETVEHLTSGCGELAKYEFKVRHDNMGLRVYWELLRKYDLKRCSKWYEEKPVRGEVRESADKCVQIWWDRDVFTAKLTRNNRPDVVVLDMREGQGKCFVVDFSVPFDGNVEDKEAEKRATYPTLAGELHRMYQVPVVIVPVVIGALGTVGKGVVEGMKVLGIPDVVDGLQTSALIGTAKILQKVLI